ncbi:MAG TPA: hypothetical protein VG125_25150 [Pirellulales bacterium]|jgi:hypothetical protein|nr:hypothetical protein [Pirellulales bacterium]
MSPLIALTALIALGAAPAAQPLSDSNTVLMTDGTTRVSLKVQLERGLRAMRPVEFKFLREVVRQVNKGTLPQDLVEQAFLWAHKQRSYRVQYFEKALQALAEQNNITFTTKVSSFDPGFNQQ